MTDTSEATAYVNYDVYLRFGAWSGRTARAWTEFLDYLPYLLQPICRKEIQYEVDNVRRGATHVDLHLTITVMTPVEPSDADMQPLVKDPVTARATATLLVWLGALRRSDGPLRDAWASWCAQEGLDPKEHTLPIYLYAHGFHLNHCDRPLPAQGASERIGEVSLSRVGSPPYPPQNLTADPQPLTDQYDGSTQTST